ncbi:MULTISPECIES: hypothetical protein [Dellaglioa]|uniref:Uncharacterized protein n=3 Tax=Dellaglioa TaxID=2767880 RepID=A0A0R1HRQ8_9LACO|nr:MULTISPECIES: hypothetical protein [Dellaglioa]KRK46388.1 hypothetical protein FC66_GL000010 [Dellaglioa algida DSM 15638]MCZ2491912.1 hypothetical protein [Dellaglioa carnosa]MCZ2493241.1 hypothetical protein [Dellaglioa carnosa]MCZ2495063.1 hypothetical protein [Dellaglioa carnosa]MDK1716649.1 hypothetical protein [Dellaglioa algida]
MSKNLLADLEKNFITSDETSKTFKVPSKKEDLTIKIDNDIFEKVSKDDEKLERLIKNLLKFSSKSKAKELISINKRNYRIFM